MKNKILIIGKIPPPVGGVGIHNLRLIQHLEKRNFPFKYLYLNSSNLLKLPFLLKDFKALHLQTSNLKLQYYITRLSKFYNSKIIITFHGDLNRYEEKNNKKIKEIIQNCDYPITLNDSSFAVSSKINKNTLKISAFIPPLNDKKLDSSAIDRINKAKKNGKIIYATNAYGYTFDKHGVEIYGILDLINHFNAKDNCLLIISDSQSEYTKIIKEKNIPLNKENILIINDSHSYFEVLKLCDASIRNTSTDGDSLSVKESLFLKKITFATNVVSRPSETILYQRGAYDFDISHLTPPKLSDDLDGLPKLIQLYDDILTK